MKSVVTVVVLVGLLAVVGCRRARTEATYEVGPDKLKSADMPEAKSLTVDFESKDNVPIIACLVRNEDASVALKAFEENKGAEQAIALAKPIARLEQPKGTLTAPVTESKTKWSVLLYAKKPTTVTVKSKGG